MTQTNTVPCVYDHDKRESCAFTPHSPSTNQTVDNSGETMLLKSKERVIGTKPNFENGYVTMNEDGLAIAMIPKQSNK